MCNLCSTLTSAPEGGKHVVTGRVVGLAACIFVERKWDCDLGQSVGTTLDDCRKVKQAYWMGLVWQAKITTVSEHFFYETKCRNHAIGKLHVFLGFKATLTLSKSEMTS